MLAPQPGILADPTEFVQQFAVASITWRVSQRRWRQRYGAFGGVVRMSGAVLRHTPRSDDGDDMNVAILLLILALLLGGVGLFIEALRWVLIVAVVLVLLSVFSRRR